MFFSYSFGFIFFFLENFPLAPRIVFYSRITHFHMIILVLHAHLISRQTRFPDDFQLFAVRKEEGRKEAVECQITCS